MKRIAVLLACVFACVALPAPSRADEDGNYTVDTKFALRQIDLNQADYDGDKLVTFDELMRFSASRFASIDASNDGFLDNQELVNYLSAYEDEHAEAFGKSVDNQMRRITELYREMDADKDGLISQKEYTDFFAQRYGLFDRNRDGSISVAEYRMDVERTPYIAR